MLSVNNLFRLLMRNVLKWTCAGLAQIPSISLHFSYPNVEVTQARAQYILHTTSLNDAEEAQKHMLSILCFGHAPYLSNSFLGFASMDT